MWICLQLFQPLGTGERGAPVLSVPFHGRAVVKGIGVLAPHCLVMGEQGQSDLKKEAGAALGGYHKLLKSRESVNGFKQSHRVIGTARFVSFSPIYPFKVAPDLHFFT